MTICHFEVGRKHSSKWLTIVAISEAGQPALIDGTQSGEGGDPRHYSTWHKCPSLHM